MLKYTAWVSQIIATASKAGGSDIVTVAVIGTLRMDTDPYIEATHIFGKIKKIEKIEQPCDMILQVDNEGWVDIITVKAAEFFKVSHDGRETILCEVTL
jgi:hypothetical protein